MRPAVQNATRIQRWIQGIKHSDWSRWLPIAEFTYNNAESTATGTTPFFANKGYHPALPTYPDRLSTSHTAHQLVTNLSNVHTCLRENLAITQEHMQSSADAAWVPTPPLKIGDKVFLHAEFIRTTQPSHKLADKYLGPFEIIRVITETPSVPKPKKSHTVAKTSTQRTLTE